MPSLPRNQSATEKFSMKSCKKSYREDKRRFFRIYRKYIEKYHFMYRDFFRNIFYNIEQYGYRSSLVTKRSEWEYKNTPAECREILIRVNIINHLSSLLYFVHQTVYQRVNKDESDITHVVVCALILFDCNARIYDVRKKYKSADMDHAYLARELLKKVVALTGNEELNKRCYFPNIIFLENRAAYPPAVKNLMKGPLSCLNGNANLALLVHVANQKARMFELRFFPELQKKYQKIYSKKDI